MIIRSQNKREITTDLNLWVEVKEVGNDCREIAFVKNGTRGIIGTYSTEEKAIKVLDMIQSAYNAIETMKIDKGAWRDNHYFQMPLDEDVEV